MLGRFVCAREVPRVFCETSHAPPYAESWEALLALLGLT
jgi:hypothetical protein